MKIVKKNLVKNSWKCWDFVKIEFLDKNLTFRIVCFTAWKLEKGLINTFVFFFPNNSDLKQRREIIDGTAHYIDQSAVRAASQGRVLVIDGIEKAERNVLPVLNNLLENREMHLEDGRLLIPASRYDKLLAQYGKDELNRWQLVRVSQDFRVVALGLPVPQYTGNHLDPPLRSRFQARNIRHIPFSQQIKLLQSIGNVQL